MCRHEWHEFMPGTDYCIKCNLRRPTPDQPAAPDEDEVRELALIIHHGANHPPEYDKACERCWIGARSAIEAGYRRPVDTRPDDRKTVSEFNALAGEIGWSQIPNGAIGNRLLEAGIIIPDPAPAAEVPVVDDFRADRLPEQSIRERLSPYFSDWIVDGIVTHLGYAAKGSTDAQ